MNKTIKAALLVTGLALILLGCGRRRPEARAEQYGEAAPLVDKAVDDLAGRISASESEVGIERVESVQFPDASLGVPEPGKMYAQVVTPGYIIELEVDGETYAYHASGNRVVLAPEDRPGGQERPGDPDISTEAREPRTTTTFTGTVELVAEDVWRVDGREIAITTKTVLEETADAGNVVRIRGIVGADDVIIAERIDVLK